MQAGLLNKKKKQMDKQIRSDTKICPKKENGQSKFAAKNKCTESNTQMHVKLVHQEWKHLRHNVFFCNIGTS